MEKNLALISLQNFRSPRRHNAPSSVSMEGLLPIKGTLAQTHFMAIMLISDSMDLLHVEASRVVTEIWRRLRQALIRQLIPILPQELRPTLGYLRNYQTLGGCLA